MVRSETYICQACSYVSAKWSGQCPQCQAWNTLELSQRTVTSSQARRKSSPAIPLVKLQDVTSAHDTRMTSGYKEWDRVVGGGIVPGAFIVLTGDPGIGKSTLLLQIAHALARSHQTVYIASEESLAQVKGRAERINCLNTPLLFSDRVQIDDIVALAEQHKPAVIVIDSIQNCTVADTDSLPGSTHHVRDIAFRCMRLAKEYNIALLVSGHITKDGNMAGPKTLEHMVDTVLYLQGEDRWQTRVLRSVKNRFGPIDEIGFFEMEENGLVELANFNGQVLQDMSYAPGAVLVSSLEGSRPVLIEFQALTIASHFSLPQRLVTGIDQKQVILIAAILEKYLKIPLNKQDIFFKVTGGFKIKSNGADLAIALALLSSYFQTPLPERSVALGEIGLTGQIKPITHMNVHINEARKFGIEKIYIAEQQKVDCSPSYVRRLRTVYDLLSFFPVEQ